MSDEMFAGIQVCNAIFRQFRKDEEVRNISWISPEENYDRMYRVSFTDGTFALVTLGINQEAVVEVSY